MANVEALLTKKDETMRYRRLLTALAACAALTVTGAVAQEPNLPSGMRVISDEVVQPKAGAAADHGALIPAPQGDVAGPVVHGDSANGYPMGGYGGAGYPYNGAWHAGYMQPMFGAPVALVVPPNSHYQTIYGWGIGATQMAPIYPQYGGPGNGTPFGDGGAYQYPPYWPSDTRQLGIYYIRGPW